MDFFSSNFEIVFNSLKLDDSKILEIDLQKHLVKLCDFPKSQKWELKYRGSRDGFDSTDFHSNCDGIANTLTIIKATSGNIFGGYTDHAWSSKKECYSDPNAFIFSLTNERNNPFKVLCSNDGLCAICCSPKYGPIFGYDGKFAREIVIKPDSNINNDSYSEIGYCYKHPEYPKETERAQTILAGSFNFKTLEIEVFTKKE